MSPERRIDLHPLSDIDSHERPYSQLGNRFLEVLRTEYIEKKYSVSDLKKTAYIQQALGSTDEETRIITSESLHDMYLTTTYIDIFKPELRNEYHQWLRTPLAALENKSPFDLILSGDSNTVLGLIYSTLDFDYRG